MKKLWFRSYSRVNFLHNSKKAKYFDSYEISAIFVNHFKNIKKLCLKSNEKQWPIRL